MTKFCYTQKKGFFSLINFNEIVELKCR